MDCVPVSDTIQKELLQNEEGFSSRATTLFACAQPPAWIQKVSLAKLSVPLRVMRLNISSSSFLLL